MPVTVLKHDVLLPSLDLVSKWMGAPTVGALFDSHYPNNGLPSRATMERIAVGKGRLQARTKQKLDGFFRQNHQGLMEDLQKFWSSSEGTIGRGAYAWGSWMAGLPSEIKADYPYTASYIYSMIQVEIAVCEHREDARDTHSESASLLALHPGVSLLEAHTDTLVPIHTLLMVLAACDAEYSATNWMVDAPAGLLNGLLQFKVDGPDSYNRALWESLLKSIGHRHPHITSWNRLDEFLAASGHFSWDEESIERKVRRYRTGKNKSGFRTLIGAVCRVCWGEGDDADAVAKVFQLRNYGATLFDCLASKNNDAGLDAATAEGLYRHYYQFHAKEMTAT